MQTCSQCHIGDLHKRRITYTNWHSNQFVIVPNLPAWQCDVCGYCQIDADAINRLMPLLGPVTRPDPTQPRRRPQPANGEVYRDELDAETDRRHA
jgi:YgiT-type zinc finger domain-containing protein